jgi:large subunit ribosomal protein L25
MSEVKQEWQLAARSREKTAKSVMNTERRNGNIAAVLYGHGEKGTSLWVERLAFEKLYAGAGESSIIKIVVDGKSINGLIQDVDFDPIAHRATHIDFLQVKMNEVLEASIPVEFVGESAAIREQGGMLVKTLEEVQVSCLPKDLPQHLEVDLAKLQTFEDSIQVGDIVVPAGVKILTAADTVVAITEAPRSAEALAALDEKVEADVTKVEGVIKADPEEKKK